MKKEKINILLIEDNQDDIDLIKKAIRKTNYVEMVTLIIARDGEEGIIKLEQSMQIKSESIDRIRIDLIICDLNMPKMNGIKFLEIVKAFSSSYKKIPVIIFTTSANLEDIKESYENYCNSYVAKPLSYLTLVILLNKMIDYWLQNQYPSE